MRPIIVFLAICLAYGGTTPLRNDSAKIIEGGEVYQLVPFVVSLQVAKKHFCGGSIYEKRHIITAATCVEGKSARDIEVLAGSVRVENGLQRLRVTEIKRHPNFRLEGQEINYNIALLVLEKEITECDEIRPIQIENEHCRGEGRVTVYGWGQEKQKGKISNVLRSSSGKEIHIADCIKVDEEVDENNVCVLSDDENGPCGVDEGGPLVNENEQLVGIATKRLQCGSWCCAKGGEKKPDVYTRASKFKNWIIENTIENNTCRFEGTTVATAAPGHATTGSANQCIIIVAIIAMLCSKYFN